MCCCLRCIAVAHSETPSAQAGSACLLMASYKSILFLRRGYGKAPCCLQRPPDAPVAQAKHRKGQQIDPEQIIQPVLAEEVIDADKAIQQHAAGADNALRGDIQQVVDQQECDQTGVDVDEDDAKDSVNGPLPGQSTNGEGNDSLIAEGIGERPSG